MPQFNNINYNNPIQLQSNNNINNKNFNSNGMYCRDTTKANNLNLGNSNNFFSYTNTNNYNFKSNNNNSPAAVLTPGRKSASPTFFHNNDSLYNKQINNYGSYLNSFPKHLNVNHYSNGYNYGNVNNELNSIYCTNQHESNLKIPTTPTRSKSLSPSLRCVIPPPRLRHKQQNKNTDNIQNTSNNNINTNNLLDDKLKNILNNENIYFEPIANLKLKGESCTNLKNNTQLNSNITTTNNNKITKEQTDNNVNFKNSKKFKSNLDNTKPSSKLNEFDYNNNIKSINEIKKPIPILPISNNDKKNDLSNKMCLNLNKIILNKNNDLKESTQNDTNDLDNLKIIEQKDVLAQNEIKIQKFLPMNVRMINLNNFPPNSAPNSKRQFSASMQRIKSENIHSSDKCFNILKQSIQFIFNEEVKQVYDKFKQNFIDPAIKNYNKNKSDSQITQNDLLFFIVNLLDEAKNNILGEDCDQLKKTPTSSTSSSFSNDSLKRKLDNESLEDLTGSEISLDSAKKKSRKSPNSIQDKNESKANDKVVKKESKFDSNTKFVLGKNVNDVYCQVQQYIYEINSEDSTSSSNQNDSKNIYSKFPNLFRYEADQHDRQWLCENNIIKRKNLKCYLLLFDDINELFMSNFKINSSQETPGINDEAKNTLLDERDEILKQLKAFTLPDFLLNKLKKNYFTKKSKFI
ncbi:unnamed protein product [Brachionus calyciflorus]|uniref:Uncharacterized protein n=1 Tax=Brachionus calyciflorus TaxID=104777 RepID=A0A813UQL3_9BILA|nr:unnamed protein product [Brachionus calyciflorus]